MVENARKKIITQLWFSFMASVEVAAAKNATIAWLGLVLQKIIRIVTHTHKRLYVFLQYGEIFK